MTASLIAQELINMPESESTLIQTTHDFQLQSIVIQTYEVMVPRCANPTTRGEELQNNGKYSHMLLYPIWPITKIVKPYPKLGEVK